jgi:hypothetical protein
VKHIVFVLAAFGLLGCGAGPEGEAAAAPGAGEPPALEAQARPGAEASGPAALDDAMVEAALAEEAALEQENAREYRRREASMTGHAECMEQARQAPEAVRPRIQEACARLADAP